jgi:hypothetical protein
LSSTATEGKDGRNAGEIVIKAKHASGLLHIYGRGENGGKGLAGKPGANGAPGATSQGCEVCRYSQGKGDAGQPFERIQYQCMKSQHDGSPGMPGNKGEDGGAGGRGGDTPPILVEVERADQLKVLPHAEVGRGAPGGLGGPGGSGGPGGAAHPPGWEPPCLAGNPGARGADGARGDNGANGAEGRVLPICLRLGGSSLGDCDRFPPPPGGGK